MSKNTLAAVDAAPHRINPRSVEPDAKLLSTPDTIYGHYGGIATQQFGHGVVYAAGRLGR